VKYEPILHVVLYQPEIPPNTGNVGRSCVAIGAKLWLVRPLGFRLDERHLRRAGLDYWQQLEWEVADDWGSLLERLPGDNHWYFSKRATRSYLSARYQQGDVLVLGCETAGLPSSMLQQRPDRVLRIPIRPEVRSLNLGSAAAVAMFEAVRQFGLTALDYRP
jgi:tRNA (cytidine/uridine-2'-O-)-methyltransferase